jgi:hypothetical protein
MAIDKMIPRFLVSDEDERLLKEGAMTDALNVSISEDGDGSEGVIKNMKGTIAATAINSGSDLPVGDSVTVIGQVSDPQQGKIYFFVADDDESSQDAIYQYNVLNDYYKLVAKSGSFSFSKNNPIKADVVNGAFEQDGNVQTILYFTDNLNPPRKLNVTRCLSSDYNLTSVSTFDYSLTTVKASLNSPPSVRFETDNSLTENGFTNDYFQFATQLIYKDGEESAISPYSELAVPSSVFQKTTETNSRSRIFENVCVINPNYTRTQPPSNPDGFNVDSNAVQPFNGIPDVESIRLLAKRGNNGSFFIVDDLPVDSNKTRDVLGSPRDVWDYTSGEYRFYNDILKVFVDSALTNKMYDNVPQKAIGQAFAGNRLFYSNYTEGYPNGGLNEQQVRAKFSQKFYAPGVELGQAQGFVVDEGGDTSNGDIVVDMANQFAWANGSTATDTVDAGTKINIEFNYSPEGTVKGTTTSGISTIKLISDQPDPPGRQPFLVGLCPSDKPYTIEIGHNGLTQVDLQIPINLTYTVPEDQSLSSVTEAIKDIFEGIERTVEYDFTNSLGANGFVVTDVLTSNLTLGDDVAFTNAKIKITYAFDDIVNSSPTDTTFTVRPYIKNISFTDLFLAGSGNVQFGSSAPGIDTVVSENQLMNVDTDPLSQDDHVYTISNNTDYVQNLSIFATTTASMSSFKAGCAHDFGIVYYDKWNRSGFVNELGSVYVKPLSQRASGEEGRCEITIGMDCEPPSWAAKWQIVYGGMSSFSDYFQYTTGGAFPLRESDHTLDFSRKRLYVSLKTLDKYVEEKSSLRNYSFTPGDILRIVSYVDNSGTTIYPSSNDPNKPIEFTVVDTVILGNSHDDNPIHPSGAAGHDVDEDFTGTFLILDAPEVNSGVTIVDSSGTSTGLKYVGFDWHSVVEAYDNNGNNEEVVAYPDGQQATAANYWGQRTVIEILTPSKSSDEKVYYEIGEARNIYTVGEDVLKVPKWNNSHGPSVTTRNGDTWLRLVSCKTPLLSDAASNDWDTIDLLNPPSDGSVHNLSNWGYLDLVLENLQVDDFEYTKEWHRGRPHVPYKNAATIRRFNGVTYSDAYAEDVANLSLSSFNPSLGNFDSLESKFGAINYIGNYNDNLVALQENKLSLVPVGKNIIQYAEGSGNVAISTNVLGQARYSSGDYGCGGHPEAVLIQDNDVFFVDKSRQAVMRLGGEQLSPISEKNMSSFFEGFFKAGHAKYVSGYDPRISTYFITGYGGSGDDYSAETVGYDVARGVWQSKYSFTPDVYANQNNMLYSAKYVGTNAFWRHDDDVTPNRNTFYGTAYPSEVEMVSKISPSRVKVYNALSYEGDSAEWDMSPGAETDLGQVSGTITSWSEKEGSYYASMPRNTSTGAFGSITEDFFVGTLSPSSGFDYKSSLRLSRIALPILSGSVKVNGTSNSILSVNTSTNVIQFAQGLQEVDVGQECTISVTRSLIKSTEDVMRGHYAKIKLTNSSNTKHELYCINTHITDSKSHHPLGQ